MSKIGGDTIIVHCSYRVNTETPVYRPTLPSTVEFYLKHLSGKTDYQFSSDGTLCKNKFGAGYCLVFSFVREDGTLHQWNAVLEQCE